MSISYHGSRFYTSFRCYKLLATIIYIGETIKDKRYAIFHTSKCVRNVRALFTLPLFLLVLYTFVSSISFVYRDEKLEQLNSKMIEGPASGIYTTELRAKQYEETINAINNYMPKEGNVLYVKLLPFAYMLSNAKPANSRLWRTNLDYPLFEEYYNNNPEKIPDAIYIANKEYGITNNNIIIGEYFQKYISSTPHEIIKLNCCTILKFEEKNE